ncbi:hypothetical protein GCM10010532_020280 [Dactylosporangium siamense]|uniref:Uncharacterized protein n=2 Tax=Dactylosporangium siamense TaxID=685454 RepID=A0A919PEC1_9ACTN|nr:hypothetical protein Dsi01nite_012710 [Dactylosporangium siamense]
MMNASGVTTSTRKCAGCQAAPVYLSSVIEVVWWLPGGGGAASITDAGRRGGGFRRGGRVALSGVDRGMGVGDGPLCQAGSAGTPVTVVMVVGGGRTVAAFATVGWKSGVRGWDASRAGT